MGDFLEMYEGLPFADGNDKKEVSPECQGAEFEAMKSKTLLKIKEFGFLSDTFTYEQKVASEIASTFPVGEDESP